MLAVAAIGAAVYFVRRKSALAGATPQGEEAPPTKYVMKGEGTAATVYRWEPADGYVVDLAQTQACREYIEGGGGNPQPDHIGCRFKLFGGGKLPGA